MADINLLKNLISPNKNADKQFFMDLADFDKQLKFENERLHGVLTMLKLLRLKKLQKQIAQSKDEIKSLNAKPDFDAKDAQQIQRLYTEIKSCQTKIESYKHFFTETYFARMDVEDDDEGYNSYYIGKHGDETLEIVDWRAPVARRYYQKTNVKFSINQYNYKLILRRALRVHSGKVEDMRNEYLSLKDYLSKEEIDGREEEVNFDPFLKDILKSRKEKQEITDIIETIQEKQYEIITAPLGDEFYVQGVAGSGKTMILLHRLSYLLYNFDDLKANDVLIITPSNSFNDFIDELATVLELGKVKTMTLDAYYDSMLAGLGIDVKNKIDTDILPDHDYLKYVYSQKFVLDLRKKLDKISSGMRGLFDMDVCGEFIDDVIKTFSAQEEKYDKIKNASTRVRRCVLGEIKEKADGGLHYTKQFRTLFNAVYTVKEFLSQTIIDERANNTSYFALQLSSFYKALRFIRVQGEKICQIATNDLNALCATLEKEALELTRYKTKVGDRQVLTYADNVRTKRELIAEATKILECVNSIYDSLAVVYDFIEVLKGNRHLVEIGKSDDKREILRHFYKELIKPVKKKFGLPATKLCAPDKYCLCLVASLLGFNLTPKHAFLFVDEAQDISTAEYSLLRAVNPKAKFNLFGDLKQNVTAYRGVSSWCDVVDKGYELNLNYRNTNQIVDFVARSLKVDMQPIGLDGVPVRTIKESEIADFLAETKGLCAIIATPKGIKKYNKKDFNVLSKTGKISKSKINVMTVFESKGLEFTAVAVADVDMTDNEKYIAYTRALYSLALIR